MKVVHVISRVSDSSLAYFTDLHRRPMVLPLTLVGDPKILFLFKEYSSLDLPSFLLSSNELEGLY